MDWPRRKLLTLLDVGVIAGGSGIGEPVLPILDGLGVWYKADDGASNSFAAQFVQANNEVLTIPVNTSLQFTNTDITWGGWIWLDSSPVTGLMGGIPTAQGVSMWRLYTDTTPQIRASVSAATYTEAVSGTLSLGAWHFIIAGYNPSLSGGQVYIMKDNVLGTVTGGTGALATQTTGYFALGGIDPANAGLTGRMQNWFVFGRDLTVVERAFLWNGGTGRRYEELTAAFKTGLRGWWPLNEASGSRSDVSGNGNHLTDNNTVTQAAGWVRNTASSGSGVQFWNDSGPNDWDLGLGAPTDAPTRIDNERNTRPVIRFDGVNDYMRTASMLGSVLSGVNAQTVFLVQKQLSTDAGSSCTYSWDSSGAASNEMSAHLMLPSNSNLYHITGTAIAGTGFTNALAPLPWQDTWHLVEMVRDGTPNSSITIEGNPTIPITLPTTGLNLAASSVLGVGDRTGRADAFMGDIAELIIYARVLTATERDSVRNYLKTKWGIAQNKVIVNTAKTGYVRINSTTNDRWAFN